MSDIDILSLPAVHNFIRSNENENTGKLALSGNWNDIDAPRSLILDQIKSRQKAKTKLPFWHSQENMLFPPPSIVEQASSEATAIFKASLVTSGDNFVDLTAGCGIDSWAFSKHFKNVHLIEKNEQAADLIAHNLKKLNPDSNIQIHNVHAEDFLKNNTLKFDYIYIDPQRRNDQKKGLYRFENCTPNILEIMPFLQKTCKKIIIKSSPMISISDAIRTLPNISNIYTVEWQGQCKEILFILDLENVQKTTHIHAVRLNDNGNPYNQLSAPQPNIDNHEIHYSDPQTYLYEPSPALQKAGQSIMAEIEKKYNLNKLAPDTHLFTSNDLIANFPGRTFKVLNLFPVNKKSIPFKKANLTIRNFPSTVDELRKKLSLKDGGNEYLFASILKDGKKILIHCHKDSINIC